MRDNHIYSSSLLHILRSSCEIARLYLWHEYHILSYEALHYASVSECFGRFLVTLGSFGLQSSDLRLQMRKEWPKSGQRVAKEWPKSGLWGVEARSHEPKPGQLKRDDDAYDASHLSPTPWKGIDLYPLHIASGAIQLATEQLPI
jgi:hypothetical protein